MIGSASLVPQNNDVATAPSLASVLFGSIGYVATIIPPAGSRVVCQHCERIAFNIIGDCLSITQRHDGQWHKTVISLGDIGLAKVTSA